MVCTSSRPCGFLLALGLCAVLLHACAVQAGAEGSFQRVLHRSGAYSSYHTLPEDMQRTSDGSESLLQECTLLQMQYVGRHGSRYPFDHMVTKYEQKGAQLRRLAEEPGTQLPSWMARWAFQPFLGRGSAGDLHEGGERELYNIAQRIKQTHPEVAGLYHFADKYVHTARSADALAFALLEGEGGIGSCADSAGSAGGYQPIYVESDTNTARRLTAYTELKGQCKTASMLQHAREDHLGAKERLLGPIGERLTRAWGIGSSYNVTASDVNHFFSLCAFEMAIAGVTDQFCSLFTEQERDKWQLYCDVSSYNEFGYGFEPYAETGAVVLQDVYAAMSAAVKGRTYAPRSVIHVGHRQTMLTLAATLGLYKEAGGVTPDSVDPKRKWRTNDIAPFAANFVFLLYDCSESPHVKVTTAEEAYFVRVLHNERDADLPQAQHSVAIPYATFWGAYASALDDSLDAICLRHTGEHLMVDTLAPERAPRADVAACPPPKLQDPVQEKVEVFVEQKDEFVLEQCGAFPLFVFVSGLLAGALCLAALQSLGLAASCHPLARRRALP